MRRLLIGLAVAAATALAPLWAFAGNQEVADQIGSRLKASGQMQGYYKIAVTYQDGTAWLSGQVSTQEQAETAMRIASQTQGVTRVENALTVGTATKQPSQRQTAAERPLQQSAGALAADQSSRWLSPVSRGTPVQQVSEETVLSQRTSSVGRAERVPTAFASMPSQPVAAVAAYQQPTLARPPVATQPSAVPPAPAAAAPIPTAVPPAAAPQPMHGAPLPIGQPVPMAGAYAPMGAAVPGVRNDHPNMPGYAWPAYAAYPNYAAITYPKQYSPTAWPYIGPFYPYPQVPLGWRKVTMEWHDGWWNLDFEDGARTGPFSGIFRPWR